MSDKVSSPQPTLAKFPWSQYLGYAAIVLGIMAITLCFFSPRYIYWSFLYSDAGSLGPEASRAQKMLLQLNDPFAKIDDPSNVVIQWRLLFPLLGHYLQLPDKVFLSLPFLGCFLVLLLILSNAIRETRSLMDGVLITAISASCSWFFVSTGWLGYFDSFYVLALMAITFYRPRWVLLLSCLLIPWVNERFILGLPLAMTIRAIRLDQLNRENYKKFLVDIALGLLLIGPFLAIRILAKKSNDGISDMVIENFLYAKLVQNNPRAMLNGLWFGLRLAWIGALYYGLFALPNSKRESKAFLIVIVLFSVYAALAISGDTSRTLSLLLPSIVMGLIKFSAQSTLPKHWRTLTLAAILGLNLVLPVQHTITTFDIKIRALPHEWQQLQNPPLVLDAEKNLIVGEEHAKRGQYPAALKSLTWAIKLDPRLAKAFLARGRVLETVKRPDLALIDYRKALQHAPADSKIAKKSSVAVDRLTKH